MVLPVYDDNPTRRPAYVTGAIIGLNIVVFLLSPARWPVFGAPSPAQRCHQMAFAQRYGALPDELIHLRPRNETFVFGVDHQCHLVATGDHKHVALSLLTHMFVHGGWLHLIGNMLFLGIFGNNVEDRLGRVRYLFFYLVVGVIGAYGFAFTQSSSNAPLVGASGAIAGILGAYLVLFPRAPITGLLLYLIPLRLPAWVVLGLWFAIQAGYARGAGLTGGDVAYLTHTIGFVFGALYALAARRRFTDAPGPPGPTGPPGGLLLGTGPGHGAHAFTKGSEMTLDGSGWTLVRQGMLPPLYFLYDADGRYVGEVARRLRGGWLARSGWDDGTFPVQVESQAEAVTLLREWWDDTGRHMSGPKHDPGED